MTADAGILRDPREEAFWASDPAILRQAARVPVPATPAPVLAIALGISAGVVATHSVMRHRLAKQAAPRSAEEARSLAEQAWEVVRPTWKTLVTPSVTDAYSYGVGSLTVPSAVLEKLAVLYAMDLGEYLHTTSVSAMVSGFSAQINGGANPEVAWKRSAAGYGLDERQTRSFITTLTELSRKRYEPMAVPEASQQAIDKAILQRADRLGVNEAYKATQMGRNTVWAYMEQHGMITDGARKRWITARDELVCPVCAPLDGVEIPLSEPFVSNGGRYYAPGVHPNCRCEIVLVNSIDIVKAMSGDPYDRDRNGRFAATEQRSAKKPQAALWSQPENSLWGGGALWSSPSLWSGSAAPAVLNMPKTEEEPAMAMEAQTRERVRPATKAKERTRTKAKAKISAKGKTLAQTQAESGTDTNAATRFHAALFASGGLLNSELKQRFGHLLKSEGAYVDLTGKNIFGYVDGHEEARLRAYDAEMAGFVPDIQDAYTKNEIRTAIESDPKLSDDQKAQIIGWAIQLRDLTKRQMIDAVETALRNDMTAISFFGKEIKQKAGWVPGMDSEEPIKTTLEHLRSMPTGALTVEIARAMDRAEYGGPYSMSSETFFDAFDFDSGQTGNSTLVEDKGTAYIIEFPKGWIGDIDNKEGIGIATGTYQISSVRRARKLPQEVQDYIEDGTITPAGTNLSDARDNLDDIVVISLIPATPPADAEIIKMLGRRLVLRRK